MEERLKMWDGYYLVKPEATEEQKSAGGLILPAEGNEVNPPVRGRVLVAPLTADLIRAGTRIMFKVGKALRLNGESVCIVDEKDVYGYFEDPEPARNEKLEKKDDPPDYRVRFPTVLGETETAVQISAACFDGPVWVPKSQIQSTGVENDQMISMTIKGWFADKQGWI